LFQSKETIKFAVRLKNQAEKNSSVAQLVRASDC